MRFAACMFFFAVRSGGSCLLGLFCGVLWILDLNSYFAVRSCGSCLFCRSWGSWILIFCFFLGCSRSWILIFFRPDPGDPGSLILFLWDTGDPGSRISDYAVRSCRSWILKFYFVIGSCGSWILIFGGRHMSASHRHGKPTSSGVFGESSRGGGQP